MKMLLVVLVVLLSGCASGGGLNPDQLVAADRAIFNSLDKTKSVVDGLCDAKVAQPAHCQQFSAVMAVALQTGASFNRAVREQKVESLGSLVATIGELIKVIRTMKLPNTSETEVLTNLSTAVDSAFNSTVKH
jgi:hypothetical protein